VGKKRVTNTTFLYVSFCCGGLLASQVFLVAEMRPAPLPPGHSNSVAPGPEPPELPSPVPAAELEQTGENIKKISHLKKDNEGSPYLNQFMFGKRLLSLVPSESQNVSAFGLRLEIFLHVITLDHANPL